MEQEKEPYKKLIVALSVVIPLAVALLFQVKLDGYDFSFLPPIYASINGLTGLLLAVGLWAIKDGRRVLHEYIMKTCIGLSTTFLVMYVVYHATSDSTTYGGEGLLKYIYFSVLISHIFLSIAIIPLVLLTFSRALSANFKKHKALARFTFPIWLYVAISGVIVYVMISPYYQ